MMLFDVLNEFDRLGSALFSAMNGAQAPVGVPLDLHRESDRYVLSADLPGVDPKSIDVSIDGQWLTVRAERSSDSEKKDGHWLVRERSDASVLRRVALGQDADVEHVEASYGDGVLRVTIPIAEHARPRKIQVATGRASQRALAGSTASSEAPASVGASAEHEEAGSKQGKAEPAHSLVH
ncbi:Hsp20/alpha crystallin family protein [Gryllotalpicola kribbensis]|jgi:HSP20 family protein